MRELGIGEGSSSDRRNVACRHRSEVYWNTVPHAMNYMTLRAKRCLAKRARLEVHLHERGLETCGAGC
jgi:hypothetical protein